MKKNLSIDSSTFIIGKKGGQENTRSVDKKLQETDIAFINDSVIKGFSKDTTYMALTENRIKNGKPRILKNLVDAEYDSVNVMEKNKLICPITGLRADTVLRFSLVSRKNEKDEPCVNICIPINSSVSKEYDGRAFFVDFKDSDMLLGDYEVHKDINILKKSSYIGGIKK